ncbi:DUF6541 family protein [Arthrobacter sp. AL12]|uniref:DUF6541 family protein n=1 Tax=Arthrobacter sp. AL12 TaxID=3042241 RepID=UPI00249B9CAB|nr:DUF6541 family protein [Arthrobacter sp. AL12]MDI3212573.1 hypothetical protein [Arthrobacter sp. AL12]
MSWLETVPFLAAAAVFLILPGGMVTLVLGLRGLPALALAPLVTVALSAVIGVALPYAGLPWSSVPILLGGTALALSLGLARRLSGDPIRFTPTEPRLLLRRQSLVIAGSYLAGAAAILAQLAVAFGTPESYSQTFDNVFHLNGVRYVLETSNASSLTMTSMTSGGQPPYFYPAAWHGLVAAFIQLTGLPLTVGVNVLNMAIASVVWPLGAMLLTRVVAGKRPVAVAAAGALSAGFAAFPILLLDFGVLYPNFLSVSMLPSSLAAVALLFGQAEDLPVDPWARFGLPLLLVPAVALAHPNGFMSLLVLSVPVAVQAYWRRYVPAHGYRIRRREFALSTAALVAGAAGFALLWKVIRPPQDAAFWGPIQSVAGAGWEVLANSAMNRPIAPGISLLMLLGLLISLRRGSRFWLLACFATTGALFVVVSGMEISPFRSDVTGVWYNDSYRLAALLPLTALPFAALGADEGWRRISAALSRGKDGLRSGETAPRPAGKALRTAGVTAALVLMVIVSQVPSLAGAVGSAQRNYAAGPDSALVSTDEQAVLDRLPEFVPDGAAVAVNPWTGAALAYALADRDTTAKHVLTANTRDVEILNAHLRDAGAVPGVCEAARATGVRYALDFGTQEVHGGTHPFPGLADLAGSSAVKLVFRQGQAALYELTACQPAGPGQG